MLDGEAKLDSYTRAHLRRDVGPDHEGARRADAGVAVRPQRCEHGRVCCLVRSRLCLFAADSVHGTDGVP